MYIPILVTVCNYINMKNVIKCLNQLNHKGTGHTYQVSRIKPERHALAIFLTLTRIIKII